jgi:outer membrane scaffolding protein for murein synthesis (MipA/OmpV family)
MQHLATGLAGMTLAAMLALVPVQEAKADGGVIIGVGAYLVGDYVVGRKCRMRHWPFNIVTKVAYGLHGKRVCRYHRYRYR